MKRLARGLFDALGAALYKVFIATLTVAFIGGGIAALANYTATQGAGTTFGSIVVSTVHYAQMMLCDLTTPSQCAAVSAAGAVKVDGSAVTQTVSGTVTANAGTNLNTSTLATSANQTNATQKSQLVDGSGNVATTQQANGHVAVDTVINDASGNRLNGLTVGTFGLPSANVVSVQNNDPCSYAAKSSAPISVTSATTTSLVAVSGATVVYVCGISFTIAPSATSADTALFEYGTGATCTSPTSLTGTYGNGDLTTAAPVVAINHGGGGQTIFKSAASAGVCILTAGTTVNIQGVLNYVQQ
jgi:hypothetical protein